MDIIAEIAKVITLSIEIVGIFIVLYGVLRALFEFFLKEFKKDTQHKKQRLKLDILRFNLGYNLVLALEFFLASDIIKTVMSPTWDELGKLGALVVIRTVLSYFLSKEIKLK